MLSFYDWYADLPVASPQVFGDQTDVPESGDWWDAGVPDPVGLQRPGHPHAGRALDDRGPLPGPEGRRDVPGLLRRDEVRRRLARPAPGHRRRAGDGDGPRRPQGVLRRPAGAALHRLRQALHRPAVPADADTARATATCRASSSPRPISATCEEGAEFKTVLVDAAHRRAARAERLARLPLRRGREGQVEPRPRRRRPAADPPRRRRARRWRSTSPASTPPAARAPPCAAASRCAGSASTW